MHAATIGPRIAAILFAALALMLSSPRTARAQPVATCGFTGVKTLVLQQGDTFPFENQLANLTSQDWTFHEVRIRDDVPFNMPGYLFNAAFGRRTLRLFPGEERSLKGKGYTLPLDTTIGRGHVTYVIYAVHNGTGSTTILRLAECEFDLTVTPF
jgi:hypothetical protein